MRNKKKIFWQCNAFPDWRWSSFNSNISYDVRDDNVMRGMVFLSPRADFWYPCAILTLENEITPRKTMGYAYFRYFLDKEGKEVVEAVVQSPGNWEVHGKSERTSITESTGGFNLGVSFNREDVFTETEMEEMEVLNI